MTTVNTFLSVLAVTFVFFVSSNGELSQEFVTKTTEKMMAIGEECQKETGATQDDIAELIEKKPPSTHEGKCMIACAAKKLGAQNSDGQLDMEGAKTALQPLKQEDEKTYNDVIDIMTTCDQEKYRDGDHCVAAAKFAGCFKEEAQKRGTATAFL